MAYARIAWRILTVPEADRAKRVAERARIVPVSAEGLTGPLIAEGAGCP
jgi:hypothetical protein